MNAIDKSISSVRNCYGCGVCAASCSKRIIEIDLNGDGFYEPHIKDGSKCTQCGICSDVCSFLHSDLAVQGVSPVKSWAAWSNDEHVRKKCSSGGLGFELGKQMLERGYSIVGCRYDVGKQRAEHYVANTVEDLIPSIGSKYIQSYTADAFKRIERKGQMYLVTGTPCQIDSFRRMIRKFHCEENFILLDFFCHCVPSMHAWKSYIKKLGPKIGEIASVSWRNKIECVTDGDTGSKSVDWHDSYNLQIRGEKKLIQSRMSQGDLFYKLFLGDITHGPQCENQCKFKYDQSSADIRIGDLWGNTYKDDQKGVSALIAFTERGRNLVEGLKDVTLIEHPFELVAEGQMRSNVKGKITKPIVMSYLKKGLSIDSPTFRLLLFAQRVIDKLHSLLGK